MDLTGVNKLSTPNVGKANLSVRWGWRKGVSLRKLHKFHLVEGAVGAAVCAGWSD